MPDYVVALIIPVNDIEMNEVGVLRRISLSVLEVL